MARTESDLPPKKRPPLYWWFLANILALAFAITSWLICLNVFRDPTNPKSYEWMLKVGRIKPLQAFQQKDLPEESFLNNPVELESRYQSYSQEDLDTLNQELKRAYLTNFKKAPFLTYVTGKYKIQSFRKLTQSDFLFPGIVIQAQALITREELPDPIPYPVFLECVFPTKQPHEKSFEVGDLLELEKQPLYPALIHVEKTKLDERDALTLKVIALHAVDYTTPQKKTLSISPPEKANVAAAISFFN
jgi:hypothetical protein